VRTGMDPSRAEFVKKQLAITRGSYKFGRCLLNFLTILRYATVNLPWCYETCS
jgi:hypothetical protein